MEAKDRAKLTTLRRTAYHEAGHFVVGWYVRRGFSSVSVKPGKDSLGHVLMGRRFAGGKEHEFREAKALLAGYIAEMRAFPGLVGRDLQGGGIVDGSFSDAEEALAIVKQYCPADEAGAFSRLSGQTLARVSVLWPAIEALASRLLKRRTLHRREAERVISAALLSRRALRNAVRREERSLATSNRLVEQQSTGRPPR
ncbi:MAG TPA: hypothetical protein PKA62_17620 [Thermoanaerobaculia bacterium]|nr:hypothetical protein [Thermoanaerobaculia bacterium]